MRWRRNAGGGMVEDRRGRGTGGFGGGRIPIGGMAGGGLGIVGLLVALVLSGVFGGGGGQGFDVGRGLDGFPEMPAAGPDSRPGVPAPNDDLAQFVSFVVEDVQQSWGEAFTRAGREYQPTTLVLFEEATATGCGTGSSATGPFYCPADAKVYLDLGFFRELRTRFGAPGDFAQAYVIAHEFGHHVQNVLGISDEARREQRRNPDDANELSVMLELQADCLAGVWAHSAYEDDLLESGDLEEGLAAAASVGDDRIQREARGRVDPETWTHGSSDQRKQWFTRGFEAGAIEHCDTFSAGA